MVLFIVGTGISMRTVSAAIFCLACSTPSRSLPIRGHPGQDPVLDAGSGVDGELRASTREGVASVQRFQETAYSAGHGVDFMNIVASDAAGSTLKRVIWISGFPRSGSSTLLSMLSTGPENAPPSDTFALFEPCHYGDEVEKTLQSRKCWGLLSALADCRFWRIKKLWGWSNPHSSGNSTPYDRETAAKMCKDAHRITFKTVDYGHEIAKWTKLLDAHPDMYMVAAVRDPRGIWASWKSMEPFATGIKEGTFYTLEQVCAAFAANIDVQHPRVKMVLFENMVRKPRDVTRNLYAALGLDFGAAQEKWIDSNFNSKDCPPVPAWQVGYDDCREDSESVAQHWRSVLSEDDLRRFKEDANCQRVKSHYYLGD